MIPWILISIGLVLGLFMVALLLYRQKHKHEPDYRTLFIMGITWVAIGLPLQNEALWIVGFILMIFGLVNKEKWKKPKKFSELSEEQKKLKIWLIIGLGVLVILGLVAFFMVRAS